MTGSGDRNNTAVGYSAGNSVTTGSNLTLLGYDAEPSSATATNEITLGDANVDTLRMGNGVEIVSGGALVGGGTNTPTFAVRLSANQTGLADNVPTTVEFDTVEIDTDSAFNTSTYTFTVPTGKGGIYMLIANCHFVHAGQINYNDTSIVKNGTSIRTVRFNSRSGDFEDEGSEIITTIETLAAGDAITIKANANSGDGTTTTLNGGATADVPTTFFRGFRLIT